MKKLNEIRKPSLEDISLRVTTELVMVILTIGTKIII